MITRQCRGLCSKHMPVLGFGERASERERKEIDEEKVEEEDAYLSLGVLHPFISDCLGDLPAPPPRFIPTLRCFTCLLSHNDIVNGNNTSAYREVSAGTMGEWQRNGKGEFVPLSSRSLCRRSPTWPRVPVKDKINSSYRGADCRILYLMQFLFLTPPASLLSPLFFQTAESSFFFLLLLSFFGG